MRFSHEATDHFLMFVCHNNLFMLMFVVPCCSTDCIFFVLFPVLTYLRKFYMNRTTDLVYILLSSPVHYVINQLYFHALRAFV